MNFKSQTPNFKLFAVTAINTESGEEGYFSMSKATVKSESSITIETTTNNFCAGDPVVFTVTLPNGYSAPALYNETQRQTITNSFDDLSGGAYAVTLTSTDNGYPYRNSTFSVTATNGACNIKALKNIYISPSLDVQVPKDKICVAETLKVTASGAESESTDPLTGEPISHAGVYTWSPSSAVNNSTGTNIPSPPSHCCHALCEWAGLGGIQSEQAINKVSLPLTP